MKNVLVVYNINAGRKQTIKSKKILHRFLIQKCNKFKFIPVEELSSTNTELYDTIIACLKPRAKRIAAATGNVIKLETSNIPTMRILAAMTSATTTINNK